jgi:hypothetical protein
VILNIAQYAQFLSARLALSQTQVNVQNVKPITICLGMTFALFVVEDSKKTLALRLVNSAMHATLDALNAQITKRYARGAMRL